MRWLFARLFVIFALVLLIVGVAFHHSTTRSSSSHNDDAKGHIVHNHNDNQSTITPIPTPSTDIVTPVTDGIGLPYCHDAFYWEQTHIIAGKTVYHTFPDEGSMFKLHCMGGQIWDKDDDPSYSIYLSNGMTSWNITTLFNTSGMARVYGSESDPSRRWTISFKNNNRIYNSDFTMWIRARVMTSCAPASTDTQLARYTAPIIMASENESLKCYLNHKDEATIGIGYHLDDGGKAHLKDYLNFTDEDIDEIMHNKRGIDNREATQLFMWQLSKDIRAVRDGIDGFNQLALPVQAAVIDTVYSVSLEAFKSWKPVMDFINATIKDYDGIIAALIDTNWYRDIVTHCRAVRNIDLIQRRNQWCDVTITAHGGEDIIKSRSCENVAVPPDPLPQTIVCEVDASSSRQSSPTLRYKEQLDCNVNARCSSGSIPMTTLMSPEDDDMASEEEEEIIAMAPSVITPHQLSMLQNGESSKDDHSHSGGGDDSNDDNEDTSCAPSSSFSKLVIYTAPLIMSGEAASLKCYMNIDATPTIGFGFNIAAGRHTMMKCLNLTDNDMSEILANTRGINEYDARLLLICDMARLIHDARTNITGFTNLAAPAQAAILDMMYSVGTGSEYAVNNWTKLRDAIASGADHDTHGSGKKKAGVMDYSGIKEGIMATDWYHHPTTHCRAMRAIDLIERRDEWCGMGMFTSVRGALHHERSCADPAIAPDPPPISFVCHVRDGDVTVETNPAEMGIASETLPLDCNVLQQCDNDPPLYRPRTKRMSHKPISDRDIKDEQLGQHQQDADDDEMVMLALERLQIEPKYLVTATTNTRESSTSSAKHSKSALTPSRRPMYPHMVTPYVKPYCHGDNVYHWEKFWIRPHQSVQFTFEESGTTFSLLCWGGKIWDMWNHRASFHVVLDNGIQTWDITSLWHHHRSDLHDAQGRTPTWGDPAATGRHPRAWTIIFTNDNAIWPVHFTMWLQYGIVRECAPAHTDHELVKYVAPLLQHDHGYSSVCYLDDRYGRKPMPTIGFGFSIMNHRSDVQQWLAYDHDKLKCVLENKANITGTEAMILFHNQLSATIAHTKSSIDGFNQLARPAQAAIIELIYALPDGSIHHWRELRDAIAKGDYNMMMDVIEASDWYDRDDSIDCISTRVVDMIRRRNTDAWCGRTLTASIVRFETDDKHKKKDKNEKNEDDDDRDTDKKKHGRKDDRDDDQHKKKGKGHGHDDNSSDDKKHRHRKDKKHDDKKYDMRRRHDGRYKDGRHSLSTNYADYMYHNHQVESDVEEETTDSVNGVRVIPNDPPLMTNEATAADIVTPPVISPDMMSLYARHRRPSFVLPHDSSVMMQRQSCGTYERGHHNVRRVHDTIPIHMVTIHGLPSDIGTVTHKNTDDDDRDQIASSSCRSRRHSRIAY